MKENVAKKAAEALSGVSAELGKITETGLKLDGFKHEIPDYFVAELPGTLRLPQLALRGSVSEFKYTETSSVSGHGDFLYQASETRDVVLTLSYKPGDRVLALPLNGGNDAIVLCKVVSGNG
ncbi:hypothetical protein [Paenibacillus sanguinis]|uniref:hypothetical protein n=1 Tax=Paenibacillus sanguinis TaxID=225906 RepID=UPI003B839533